jgi:uncharacterized protein YlxW (UPF0749 family)
MARVQSFSTVDARGISRPLTIMAVNGPEQLVDAARIGNGRTAELQSQSSFINKRLTQCHEELESLPLLP